MTVERRSLPWWGRRAGPRREGSPWTGLWAVSFKELADHLASVRMRVLEGLILLTALGTVVAAIQTIRSVSEAAQEDPFLFLRIFTLTQSIGELDYSFVLFLSFLVPLAGIGLGFDAVNGEHNRRTLSRILSQPIYRDALLAGKFLAGLLTLAISLLALWLLVTGLSIFRLGVIPGGEEVARGLLFFIATVAYGGIWLAVAMFFSVQFRQPATSALAALGVWLFFVLFWPIIPGVIAQVLRPAEDPFSGLAQEQLRLALSRLSPNTLYSEVLLSLLNPELRALGPVLITPLEALSMVRNAPLPLSQSLLLSWPQFTGMIAALLLLFAGAYVLFQRQEIRA